MSLNRTSFRSKLILIVSFATSFIAVSKDVLSSPVLSAAASNCCVLEMVKEIPKNASVRPFPLFVEFVTAAFASALEFVGSETVAFDELEIPTIGPLVEIEGAKVGEYVGVEVGDDVGEDPLNSSPVKFDCGVVELESKESVFESIATEGTADGTEISAVGELGDAAGESSPKLKIDVGAGVGPTGTGLEVVVFVEIVSFVIDEGEKVEFAGAIDGPSEEFEGAVDSDTPSVSFESAIPASVWVSFKLVDVQLDADVTLAFMPIPASISAFVTVEPVSFPTTDTGEDTVPLFVTGAGEGAFVTPGAPGPNPIEEIVGAGLAETFTVAFSSTVFVIVTLTLIGGGIDELLPPTTGRLVEFTSSVSSSIATVLLVSLEVVFVDSTAVSFNADSVSLSTTVSFMLVSIVAVVTFVISSPFVLVAFSSSDSVPVEFTLELLVPVLAENVSLEFDVLPVSMEPISVMLESPSSTIVVFDATALSFTVLGG